MIHRCEARIAAAGFAIALFLSNAGCHKAPETPLPKTYPVTGRIVDRVGKPLKLGTIQFESMVEVRTQALGKVEPDGSFKMTTVIGAAMVPGAIEGPHKVTFLPVDRDQLPAYFDAPFKVVPGENTIQLTYPARAIGEVNAVVFRIPPTAAAESNFCIEKLVI